VLLGLRTAERVPSAFLDPRTHSTETSGKVEIVGSFFFLFFFVISFFVHLWGRRAAQECANLHPLRRVSEARLLVICTYQAIMFDDEIMRFDPVTS
jgi:hypothetical protein